MKILKKLLPVILFVALALTFVACEKCEHEWVKEDCGKPMICAKCNEKDGLVADHNIVVDEAVAATCTKTGLTQGRHCLDCGEVTVAQQTIAIDSEKHDIQTLAAVPATCTKYGVTEGKKCKDCNKVFVSQYYTSMIDHDDASTGTCTMCKEVTNGFVALRYAVREKGLSNGSSYIIKSTVLSQTDKTVEVGVLSSNDDYTTLNVYMISNYRIDGIDIETSVIMNLTSNQERFECQMQCDYSVGLDYFATGEVSRYTSDPYMFDFKLYYILNSGYSEITDYSSKKSLRDLMDAEVEYMLASLPSVFSANNINITLKDIGFILL